MTRKFFIGKDVNAAWADEKNWTTDPFGKPVVDFTALAVAQLQGHKYGRAEAVRQRLLGADRQTLKAALRRFKRMKRDRLKRFLKDHPERLEGRPEFIGSPLLGNITTYSDKSAAPPLTLETLNAAIKLIESQHAMPRGAL